MLLFDSRKQLTYVNKKQSDWETIWFHELVESKRIKNLDNKIKRLRSDISHRQLILSCSVNNSYTKHQRSIRERLRYKFGNVKRDTLLYWVKMLTQELKATSSKVSYYRKKIQLDRINRLFAKKANVSLSQFTGR